MDFYGAFFGVVSCGVSGPVDESGFVCFWSENFGDFVRFCGILKNLEIFGKNAEILKISWK